MSAAIQAQRPSQTHNVGKVNPGLNLKIMRGTHDEAWSWLAVGRLVSNMVATKFPVQRDRVTGSTSEALVLMCRRHGLMRIAVTVLKARS